MKTDWGSNSVSWTHLQLFEGASWWLPSIVIFRWHLFVMVPIWYETTLLFTANVKYFHLWRIGP